MNQETNLLIGKALLSVGAGILIGTVVSEVFDGEPTREVLHPSSRKRKTTKDLSDKVKTKSRKFLVEIPNPRQEKISRSEVSPSQNIRKYPDHYYSLTKSQQYKYRQRMAQDLYELSKNN